MAVTMASGLAIENVDVFVPIYSTFLQRAYDQVNHDVARQNVKVIFGIDRAGIVGADGETHQGVFDIALLRHIPNMTIVHPRNPVEAFALLNYGFKMQEGPFVIRYQRGSFDYNYEPITDEIATLSWDTIIDGNKAIFVSFGEIVNQMEKEIQKSNHDIMLINAKSIKPLDEKVIHKIIEKNVPIILYEEGVVKGGFGSSVIEYLVEQRLPTHHIHLMGIPDQYIAHGSKEEILKE
jgi:1-deoxy-D-xylulose-5-phosphate synthase